MSIKGILFNTDMVRAMSDEELARFCDRTCPPNVGGEEHCQSMPCADCWLDWLKQEVET